MCKSFSGDIGVARIFSGRVHFLLYQKSDDLFLVIITLSYVVIYVIYCHQLPFYLICGVHLTKFSPILPHSSKNA